MRVTRSMLINHVALAAIVLLLIVFLAVCDSNGPTVPTEPEPTDYLVWLTTDDAQSLYAYHTATGEVDTVDLPFDLAGVGVTASHDGSRLYAPLDSSIRVLNASTLETVMELPYRTVQPVIVSPAGGYIAVIGDSLRILDATDFSVVHIDSRTGCCGSFSADEQYLFVTSSQVVRFSLVDEEQVTAEGVLGSPRLGTNIQAIPIGDATRLLVHRLVELNGHFVAIWDTDKRSVLAEALQLPTVGRIAVTPNGNCAYYGHADNREAGLEDQPGFTQYDLVNYRVVKKIATTHFVDSITPEWMRISDIVITPDGRWLIGMEGNEGSSLLKYDLLEEELVDYFAFEDIALGISVQPSL